MKKNILFLLICISAMVYCEGTERKSSQCWIYNNVEDEIHTIEYFISIGEFDDVDYLVFTIKDWIREHNVSICIPMLYITNIKFKKNLLEVSEQENATSEDFNIIYGKAFVILILSDGATLDVLDVFTANALIGRGNSTSGQFISITLYKDDDTGYTLLQEYTIKENVVGLFEKSCIDIEYFLKKNNY